MKSASIIFPLGKEIFFKPFWRPNDPSHSPSAPDEGMLTFELPINSILRVFKADSTAVDNLGLTNGACHPCGDPLEFTSAALAGLAGLSGWAPEWTSVMLLSGNSSRISYSHQHGSCKGGIDVLQHILDRLVQHR